jgi:hypothetical protein
MILRFRVDQRAAFRAGIDAPKNIIEQDINPATLPPELRELIAARLDDNGVDVCALSVKGQISLDVRGKHALIQTLTPDIAGLVRAVVENENQLQAQKGGKELDPAALLAGLRQHAG